MIIINSTLNGAPISPSGYKHRKIVDADAKIPAFDQPREATPGKFSLGFIEANANVVRARIQTVSKMQSQELSIIELGLPERLALIKQEGSQIDRTNMSDKEVMEEIHERFKKYLTASEFPPVSETPDYPGKNDIVTVYNNELFALQSSGWSDGRIQNAFAAMLGYEELSHNEMKAAIVQKYASEPMTPYRFCAMMDEMRLTGAMDMHDAIALASSVMEPIQASFDPYFLGDGYSSDELHRSCHQVTSFGALYAEMVFRMTTGGWKSPSICKVIDDFFGYVKTLGY